MHKAQLAKIPVAAGRRTERRMVNLAASLREPGATVADAAVLNLSVDGFMAESSLAIEEGNQVWLKLPGLEAMKAQVAWVDGEKAGFEFAAPLHPSVLDALAVSERRGPPKNHFGPRRFGA